MPPFKTVEAVICDQEDPTTYTHCDFCESIYGTVSSYEVTMAQEDQMIHAHCLAHEHCLVLYLWKLCGDVRREWLKS